MSIPSLAHRARVEGLPALRFIVLLLAGGLPVSSVSAQPLKNGFWSYTLDAGQATVTGYRGPGGEVEIPAQIDGYPVVSIRRSGFPLFRENNAEVTSVTIPYGVQSIGDAAFAGSRGLVKVSIPATVELIGECAFAGCTALAELSLPDGLDSIGDAAFIGCRSLTNLVVPASVARIRDEAFADCTSLTNVTVVGNSPLGLRAFAGCVSLTTVTLASWDAVGFDGRDDSALSGCRSLTNILVAAGSTGISSVDGVLFTEDGRTLLKYPQGKHGDYIIPEGVTQIEAGAFAGANGLTGVTVPGSVNYIPEGAFWDCTNLTNVALADGVKDIDQTAFWGCRSLTSFYVPKGLSLGGRNFMRCSNLAAIDVDPDHAEYSSVDGVLMNKEATEVLQYPPGKKGAYSLAPGLRIADEFAFHGCTGLTAIDVDSGHDDYSSVDGVLFDKDGRTLLQYPPGRTGPYVVPENVESIEWGALLFCASLTSITIPESVQDLGGFFYGCSNLASIIVAKENASFSSVDGVLFDKDGRTLLQYPPGRIGPYVVPENVESIEWGAFAECSGLEELVFLGSPRIDEPFATGSTNLASILLLADQEPQIDEYALFGAPALTFYRMDKANGWWSYMLDQAIVTVGHRPVEVLDAAGLRNFTIGKIKESPGSYGLYSESQVQFSRAQGRSDVTNDPSAFGLFTQAQYEANRINGQADVTTNPSAFGLYTQEQCDALAALQFSNGQSSVATNPSAFGLYTQAQYDERYTTGAVTALASVPAVEVTVPAPSFLRIGADPEQTTGLVFSNLPAGWSLDGEAGVISGFIDGDEPVNTRFLAERGTNAPVSMAVTLIPEFMPIKAVNVSPAKKNLKKGQSTTLMLEVANASEQAQTVEVQFDSSDEMVVKAPRPLSVTVPGKKAGSSTAAKIRVKFTIDALDKGIAELKASYDAAASAPCTITVK